MFIVLLKFSDSRANAPQLMTEHDLWIKRGFDDGVFLLVGSLPPKLGGGIVAHGVSRSELELRVSQDPFVSNDVVKADIVELSAWQTDPRLAFLLG